MQKDFLASKVLLEVVAFSVACRLDRDVKSLARWRADQLRSTKDAHGGQLRSRTVPTALAVAQAAEGRSGGLATVTQAVVGELGVTAFLHG